MASKPSVIDPADERAAAIQRLSARRDFGTHVVCYVVVNLGLIAIWYIAGHSYFWPGWVLAAWGIGIVLHAWDVYGRRPITEADIAREMGRHTAPPPG
ncbi:MAG: 2TM domain-containing protein [Candidatus Dormibacteria bacterium]|jgi:hypothetical protein